MPSSRQGVLAGPHGRARSTSARAALVGLLDAVRVDPPVEDQRLEGEPADLPAHRVEAGQQDRLGRVVDDEVDPGDRLEGADVAALAADDAALHVVAGQVQDRDDRLGGLLGGQPLDRAGDDLAGAGLALARAASRSMSRTRSAASRLAWLLDRRRRSSALASSAVSPAVRSRTSRRSSSSVGELGRPPVDVGVVLDQLARPAPRGGGPRRRAAPRARRAGCSRRSRSTALLVLGPPAREVGLGA